MPFHSVRLYNYRNLRNTTVSTDAEQVFLVGRNGQGKTNFLEAIYFACYASSFRTRRDDALRRTGTDEMAVEARYGSREEKTILVKQRGRKKEIEVDGLAVTDRKEIVSTVPCIVFCHDDISFVTGPPDMQRWFINQTQALLEGDHVGELRTYGRILRARNAALKSNQLSLLDVLDQQLSHAGMLLQRRRERLCYQLAPILRRLFNTVFGENYQLEFIYRPSWDGVENENETVALLAEYRDRDIDMRTTTSGPHRDKFPILLSNSELTGVASTGQLRLVSLLLRVAQAVLVAEAKQKRPVLLLDDVLLELDPDRRARFVGELPDYEQVFFTFLPDEQYSRLQKTETLIYRVEDGVIEKS